MTTFQKIVKYLAFAFAIFLSISIISGILGAITVIPEYFGKGSAGARKEYTFSTEFTEIRTDLTASSLEIKTGETFKVESNHKYIECREEGNCLVIKEKKSVFPLHWDHIQVTVTIPQETVFQTAEIDAGAGEVTIEELAADSLTLKLGAGELQAKALTANHDSRIDGGAGSITITNGALNNADIDVAVGELDFSGTLTGESSVDYGIGETRITLAGSEKDYQISLDKGVGEATIDGMSLGDNSVYGTGDNRIDVDGGVGELNISFQSIF